MNVLCLFEEGRLGGPQIRIHKVAKGLKQLGVDLTIVLPGYQSEQFQELLKRDELNFKVLMLHRLTKDVFHLFKYVLFFVPELLMLMWQLFRFNPDVVHVTGAWQVKGIIASVIMRKKRVWELNDTFLPSYLKPLFKLLRPLCNSYIFAGKSVERYYLSEFNLASSYTQIIPSPVDTSIFKRGEGKGEPCLDASKINVVTVANVNRVKGMERLIEVASHIQDKRIVFNIVGAIFENNVPYYESLIEEIDRRGLTNIRFLGAKINVKDYLESADIYFCTSDFEASPLSVWEAMSMGLPIVSTDVGDVPEYVSSSEGCVHSRDDISGIAASILDISNDETKRASLGASSRKVAVENLDTQFCVKKHRDIYTKVVSGEVS